MSVRPLTLLVALAGASCIRQQPSSVSATTTTTPALPELLTAQLAPPAPAASTIAAIDTAREPHVDIDTHSRDEDVRPLLEFVARAGGYRLIYPANLSRKVRVELNDVPASVALATLLELADLTLEPTTPTELRPLNRPVVFYELPVNVDSLSADAIVARFGVSRAVADMIVAARRR
jgi:hypothetical protein